MGNFVCGEYVILNSDDSKTNESSNNEIGGGDIARPSALDVSRQIQRQMLTIRGEFMTDEGRRVNYDEIKKSQIFAEYLRTARLLRRCTLASLDDENERKAFFINVYNALNIHGVIAGGGLPESLVEKLGYWKRTGYWINGMRFTLDDIEHGILRGNSRASSQVFGSSYFPKSDPRLKLSLPKDPRIHFALNCGARSCPAIRVYDGVNLERGLNGAAKSFCESEVRVIEEENVNAGLRIELSHLFKWFRGDFVPKNPGGSAKNGDPVLRWLVENVPELESSERIRSALERGETVKIEYSTYDWTTNDQ